VQIDRSGAFFCSNNHSAIQCRYEDCGGTGTCNLTMNANKSTTATFAPSVVNYNLNVTVLSEGTVESDRGSISCDPDCSDSFSSGDVVTLTASPSKLY
jgi:hypothetical protein